MSIRKTLVAVACAAFAVLGTAGTASAHGHDSGSDGASAVGVANDSPGILSGDVIQVPVNLDLNLCGNSIDIIGLLNPVIGNNTVCVNK